jgi:hypothetical protein
MISVSHFAYVSTEGLQFDPGLNQFFKKIFCMISDRCGTLLIPLKLLIGTQQPLQASNYYPVL